MLKTCHAAKFLKVSILISRMPHVLEMVTIELWIFWYSSGVVGSNCCYKQWGIPVMFHCLDEQHFPSNEEIFPSDHDPITCDKQASMLEQEQVLLQDTSTMSTLIWRI